MEQRNGTGTQDNTALLQELVRLERSRLRHARFTTIFCVVLLAAVALAAILYGPRIIGMLANAENAVSKLSEVAEDVESLSSEANRLVQNINRVVIDNTQSITNALEKLNGVDFDRLNDVIDNLANTVEALSNITSIFR